MKKSKILTSLVALVMAAGIGAGVVSCGGGGGGSSANPGKSSESQPEKTLESIAIKHAPTKVDYQDGEEFDPAGLEIEAVFSDQSKEPVALSDVTFDKTTLSVGDTVVKATYRRKTVDIAVTVRAIIMTDMTLQDSEVTLHRNETKRIVANFSPANVSEKGLTYTTSDAQVATVSDAGEIRGVKVGQATITVTTVGKKADGSAVSRTIAVTVVATEITTLTIAQEEVALNITEEDEHPTAQVEYEILPANADEKGATFASDHPEIASVSDAGLITAQAVGEAVITVTSKAVNAQGQHLTGQVHVTVVSEKFVVEFVNYDGSLLQGFKAEDLEDGVVPEFTGNAPKRAADENAAYIFRGFDKVVAPYDESATEKVTYKAVFEGVRLTLEKAYITVESNDQGTKVLYTYEGHTIGYSTADLVGKVTFKLFSMSNWAQWKAFPVDPEISADGAWTVSVDVSDVPSNSPNYYTRIDWGNEPRNIELKPLYKESKLRYRHDPVTGAVYEINTLGDNWDGETVNDPDTYADTAYLGFPDGLTKAQMMEKYLAAVPMTWIGFDTEYTEAPVLIDEEKAAKLSIPNYGLLCLSTVAPISISYVRRDATLKLEEKADGIYVSFSGVFSVDALPGVTVTNEKIDAALANLSADIQMAANGYATTRMVAEIDKEAKTYYISLNLTNNDSFTFDETQTYWFHFIGNTDVYMTGNNSVSLQTGAFKIGDTNKYVVLDAADNCPAGITKQSWQNGRPSLWIQENYVAPDAGE